MTKLSIIVPCFNCENTVEQAVESIFRQESQLPFDVTMVDDGSTDHTYVVLDKIKAKHPNIKLVRHPSNRGGGAARNTAVANCDGEIILCLDSDNMLGPDFLRNMTGFWLEKQCDAVGISTSVKFRGSDIRNVVYTHEFENPGQAVSLESLFDGARCPLYSTLLYTRPGFLRLGGYPTDHGFDTQGLAIRFMYSGLTAYTCPGTLEYHRVGSPVSYYTREDRAGRAHWNMFRIFDEFLYLFRDDLKAEILDYDTFPNHAQSLLMDQLYAAQQKGSIYREGYPALMRLGRAGAAEALRESTSKYDRYWLGTYHLSAGREAEALECFREAIVAGFNHPIIYCVLLEAAVRVSRCEDPVTVSIGNLVYHIGRNGSHAESGAAALSPYIRLENRLSRQTSLALLVKLLRDARRLLRRVREMLGWK